jgi:hypothetical protein
MPRHSLAATKKFIAGIPNRGAGIGHAFTDWARAFWTAQSYDLDFLYSPFTRCNSHWETILGLGASYPRFNEKDLDICFYASQHTLEYFLSCNIPNARAAYVIDGNHSKCYAKSPKEYDSLSRYVRKQYLLSRRVRPLPPVFNPCKIGVAVHIRRGDIIEHENLRSRAQSYEHFSQILNLLCETFSADSLDVVILTNQITKGVRTLAESFGAKTVDYRNDIQDFHALVTSDIILASNSGFSYLATLINRESLKIVPDKFWHQWPPGSIVFDGSEIATSLLLQKCATWTKKTCKLPALNLTLKKQIWNNYPSIIASNNTEFRDINHDNVSTRIRLFPRTVEKEAPGSSLEPPIFVKSRKLYGCVINTVTQSIELATNIGSITEIISEPSAFIQFSNLSNQDELFYKLICRFIKTEFNEAIMGRTMLIPSSFSALDAELRGLDFHKTISFKTIESSLAYCSNLIALQVDIQL